MVELGLLRDLLTRSRSDLLRTLSIDPKDVDDGVTYGGLTGLARAKHGARPPAFLYFRADAVVLVYVSDRAYLAAFTAKALKDRLGPPELELRSRAGKTSVLAVYPAAGVAFSYSSDAHQVEFLEVFPATSAEAYLRDIYRTPGGFVK